MNSYLIINIFLIILCKGNSFCDFLFAFQHNTPSETVSTLKGKNLLTLVSKFFPLRVDPISKRRQNNFDRVASPKHVSSPHMQENT